MQRHAVLLTAMLVLALPSAASATQGAAGATATPAHAVAPPTAHQTAPADTRVAIILQRKPTKKSGR
jgi:hypothetical protein